MSKSRNVSAEQRGGKKRCLYTHAVDQCIEMNRMQGDVDGSGVVIRKGEGDEACKWCVRGRDASRGRSYPVLADRGQEPTSGRTLTHSLGSTVHDTDRVCIPEPSKRREQLGVPAILNRRLLRDDHEPAMSQP